MRSLLFLLCTLAPFASATAQSLLPEIEELIERGTLKVAMINRDTPPLLTTDDDGSLRGYDVQIANAIAADLGVDLEIVRTESTYDGVIDQVARGEADVGVSYLSRTVGRARKVLFTRPYLTQNLTLLLNRVHAVRHGDSCPNTADFVASLADLPTGVEKGSAYANRLAALDPKSRLTQFDTFAAMMQALRTGGIVRSFQGEIVALSYLADNPEMRIYAELCTLSEWQDNIAIAVHGNNATLARFLDVVLDNIRITFDKESIQFERHPWSD